MPVAEPTQIVPLSTEPDGTMRIANTRVSLDSVLHHYCQGATAEEIVLRFPALRLADIHSCLAYYLNNQKTLAAYLTRQRDSAGALKEQISADPAQQHGASGMRDRIKARLAERREETR